MRPIFLVEMEQGKVGETERSVVPIRACRSYKQAMEYAAEQTKANTECLKNQGLTVVSTSERHIIYLNRHNDEVIVNYLVTAVATL